MADDPFLLLIDDEPAHHTLADAVLTAGGWRVDHADDGETGVGIAASRRYALVLIDIQMPGMTGFEASCAIRNGPGASASAPILAFTAQRGDDLEAGIRAAGMDGLVAKPFTAETLREAALRWWPTDLPAPVRRLAATFGTAEIAGLIDRFRAQLEQTLAYEDNAGDIAHAHKLAGVAGTLGFPDVHRPWLAVSEGDASAYAEARTSARQALAQIAAAGIGAPRAEGDRRSSDEY